MIGIPGTIEIIDDRNLACDWIELSAWRSSEPISKTDVYDRLEEEYLGDENGTTSEVKENRQAAVDNIWLELKSRQKRYSAAYPFKIRGDQIELIGDACPFTCVYVFFLVVSMARHCSHWHKENESYIEQGSLFELIVEEACHRLFPKWECWRSGWGADNAGEWPKVVEKVCELLRADEQEDSDIWKTPHAKERGLDILLFRKFEDDRPSLPCFLIQCGSGKHWPKKLTEPELNIWNSAIKFYCEPNKAFSCPYLLDLNEYKRTAERVKPGFLLDRERLLLSFCDEPDIEQGTLDRMRDWISDKAMIVC